LSSGSLPSKAAASMPKNLIPYNLFKPLNVPTLSDDHA
jgi:hypothetical protein